MCTSWGFACTFCRNKIGQFLKVQMPCSWPAPCPFFWTISVEVCRKSVRLSLESITYPRRLGSKSARQPDGKFLRGVDSLSLSDAYKMSLLSMFISLILSAFISISIEKIMSGSCASPLSRFPLARSTSCSSSLALAHGL